MSLFDLAERCERATEPDRELDAAVCAAFGVSQNQPDMKGVLGEPYCRPSDDDRKVQFGTFFEGRDCRMAIRDPLPVTASLDAALTLVPGGMTAAIFSDGTASIAPAGSDETAFFDATIYAATPALALCAAALKARAEQTERTGA